MQTHQMYKKKKTFKIGTPPIFYAAFPSCDMKVKSTKYLVEWPE